MFVNAIDYVSQFTRPIHSILRNYGSTDIELGCSTIIVVNDEGYAITCKHVIDGLIAIADSINNRYTDFKKEIEDISSNKKKSRLIKEIENRYGYSKKNPTTIQLKNQFVDIVDQFTEVKCIVHPQYDIALIKFEGFNKILCPSYPVFAKDGNNLKQGMSLCRLGFPYAEFSNYKYNHETDDIEWINNGGNISPMFPMDGIITRFVADNGIIVGIEMSTPGLKGQSGGPLFDKNGIIYGMQFQTKSLPLGFDQIDREIIVNGKKKRVNDYSFLHLGRCIHINVIKDFLNQHRIKYQVEP